MGKKEKKCFQRGKLLVYRVMDFAVFRNNSHSQSRRCCVGFKTNTQQQHHATAAAGLMKTCSRVARLRRALFPVEEKAPPPVRIKGLLWSSQRRVGRYPCERVAGGKGKRFRI